MGISNRSMDRKRKKRVTHLKNYQADCEGIIYFKIGKKKKDCFD